MGKVILPLSEGELSEKTIFDRRFVIECCETFHLHWRNLRLELSADNWLQLVDAFETGIAKWRAARVAALAPAPRAGALPDGHERDRPPDDGQRRAVREPLQDASRDAWRRRRVLGRGRLRPLPLSRPARRDADRRLPRLLEDDVGGAHQASLAHVPPDRGSVPAARRGEHRLRRPAELGGAARERRRRPALRPRPARPSAPRRAGRPALARRAHPRRGLPRPAQGAGPGPGRASRATSSSTSARPTTATCPRTGAIAS